MRGTRIHQPLVETRDCSEHPIPDRFNGPRSLPSALSPMASEEPSMWVSLLVYAVVMSAMWLLLLVTALTASFDNATPHFSR